MPPNDDSSWMEHVPSPPAPELIQRIKEASTGEYDPWKDMTQQPTLKVWRISNYRAVPCPEEEYGTFFDRDVFIVVNTLYRNVMSSNYVHDIHLWLGKKANQKDLHAGIKRLLDLDERLHNESLLHRQVSGREDNTFRQFFNTITVYRGRASDSYRYRPGETQSARLMKYYKPSKRAENYRVKEISPLQSNLQPEYNYVMDIGKQIYLWAGSMITQEEKMQAVQYCESMVATRGLVAKLEVMDEDTSEEHYFHFYLQNKSENLVDSDDETASDVSRQATLSKGRRTDVLAYRVKIKGKEFQFLPIKGNNSGIIKQDLAEQDGVCIIDTGFDCFVWLGKKPTPAERRNAIFTAHVYLHRTTHPHVPVTVVRDGQPCPAFNRAVPQNIKNK